MDDNTMPSNEEFAVTAYTLISIYVQKNNFELPRKVHELMADWKSRIEDPTPGRAVLIRTTEKYATNLSDDEHLTYVATAVINWLGIHCAAPPEGAGSMPHDCNRDCAYQIGQFFYWLNMYKEFTSMGRQYTLVLYTVFDLLDHWDPAEMAQLITLENSLDLQTRPVDACDALSKEIVLKLVSALDKMCSMMREGTMSLELKGLEIPENASPAEDAAPPEAPPSKPKGRRRGRKRRGCRGKKGDGAAPAILGGDPPPAYSTVVLSRNESGIDQTEPPVYHRPPPYHHPTPGNPFA